MSFPPADIFVKTLNDSNNGKLNPLKLELSILGGCRSRVRKFKLSRRRNPPLTYRIKEMDRSGKIHLGSWVVKFNPVEREADSWYNVKREYDILCGLHSKGISVPAPLYRSNEDDENIIGTDFIVMEFIEGKQVDCIGDIKKKDVQEDAVLSVANFLGELHQHQWEDDDEDDDFWEHQITTWSDNFQIASPDGINDPFYPLFVDVSTLSPPDGDYSIIHGDMTISNVIFDDEYNVKAVIDWKYQRNGDPMMDLSYFCMMFLGRDKGLRRVNKLLAGDSVDESDVLERYCESRGIDEVDDGALNFAKSVSCLRMMSIVKAAEVDNFVNHECGQYMDKKLAPKVMKFLETAGQSFMKKVD